MAEMTLEKAERILEKARALDPENRRTDIQIIRERCSSYMGGAVTMAFFGINLVRFSGAFSSAHFIVWGLCLLLYAFAGVMFYQGIRYSRIRAIFEAAGPQSIADLKNMTSPAAGILPQ